MMPSSQSLELQSVGNDSDLNGRLSRSVRIERRRSGIFNTNEPSDRGVPLSACDNDLPAKDLLLVLRLMRKYGIHSFSVPQNLRWNRRHELGEGASFAVQEYNLPMWSAFQTHQRYRDLNVKGPNERFHFTDHANTTWNSSTRVAYKAVNRKSNHLKDVLSELRILCHPPLLSQENIACFLGVAWIMQQKTDALRSPTTPNSPTIIQEWPVLVLEKAKHGSLTQFMESKRSKSDRLSLNSKLRLCIDVLNGLCVSLKVLSKERINHSIGITGLRHRSL